MLCFLLERQSITKTVERNDYMIIRSWRAVAGNNEVLENYADHVKHKLLKSFNLKVEYFETVVSTGILK